MRAGSGGLGNVATKVVAASLLGLQCLMPAAALANQMAGRSPVVVAGVKIAKPVAALSTEEEMIGAFKTTVRDLSMGRRFPEHSSPPTCSVPYLV